MWYSTGCAGCPDSFRLLYIQGSDIFHNPRAKLSMYIDFHPWEYELVLILFDWGEKKEFAKSAATCHVPETILISSNEHIWHCGCDLSYHLLEFMVLCGHHLGSIPFLQGPDCWIKWRYDGNYNLCILQLLPYCGTNFSHSQNVILV